MGHTPEQRSEKELCGAKLRKPGKQNNRTCRNWAGQRTSHQGSGKCWLHGGNTPSHQKHGAVVKARKRMVELGKPVDVTPGTLMAGVICLQAGDLTALTTAIRELEDETTPEGQALIRLYTQEKERSARISKLAADMGVDERLINLAEQQTDATIGLLAAIADDIGLTEKQRRAMGPAIRRQLAVIEGAAQGSTRPKGKHINKEAA